LDATSDGLWDWRVQSGEAFCNPAFLAMLGFPTSDVIPDLRSLFQALLHPDDRETTLSAIQPGWVAIGSVRERISTVGPGRAISMDIESGPGG